MDFLKGVVSIEDFTLVGGSWVIRADEKKMAAAYKTNERTLLSVKVFSLT